ncbi:MAG TPA: dihydrodipicolinate synthase family protein, partial [Clostridiaceae bacterium]|nr:dihydrodipicolinate synthase family protein [Clostridiaceae bacterium]
MAIFKGAGVAIITPFNETGVDYQRFEKLLNWHVEQGTDAIVVCGTTGEASTMSTEEKKEAIAFTVKTINGRIPVIAGTGSNDTRATVEMSRYAESVGADGLLIINPYYNKTSNEGLFRHFEAVHDATGIPIVVYNVPSRTGMNITP